MARDVESVRQFRRRERQRGWSVALIGTALAAGAGLAAAKLAGGRVPAEIIVFPLALVPVALWRWPRASLVALLAGSMLIEQTYITIGTHKGPFTEHIALFHSVTKGTFFTPAELLLAALLVVWVMKGALERDWRVPRSPLAKGIAAMYAVALVVGVGLGQVHHGSLQFAFWELRPWYYVGATYLLVSSLFAGRDLVRPLLWTIVLGTGFKSVQGVIVYFRVARHMTPRPEAILSHEESFFFAVFLLATTALWLFQIRGPLRAVATILAPFVVVADLGNARRTSFLLLYVGLPALLFAAHRAMPERRKMLVRLDVAVLVLAVVYIGVFWNHDQGSLGQGARAVHSAIAPSARDQSSDQYRNTENADLIFDIHATRSIGQGYGVPINYVIPTADISTFDPMIAYIPHDSILYEWYRLGLLGELLLWSIVAFGILAAGRLVRRGTRDTAVVGALGICSIICWILMGYNDVGLTQLRIATFMGFIFGAIEVLNRRLVAPDAAPDATNGAMVEVGA